MYVILVCLYFFLCSFSSYNLDDNSLHFPLLHQVIFRGGMVFRNCLKRDVEFELILHHVEVVGRLKQQKISQVTSLHVISLFI